MTGLDSIEGVDLKEVDKKCTVLLVAPFGPFRQALDVAELAASEGSEVIFVVFKPQWRQLLATLVGNGIEVIEVQREITFSLRAPLQSFRDLWKILQVSAKLERRFEGAEIYLFGASIVLPMIIVSGRLACGNTCFYTPKYEGRGESWSHLSMPEKNPFRCAKAWFLSVITGLEIEPRRPWSPVYTLSDRFLRKHCRDFPPWVQGSSKWMQKIKRPCSAKVLILFTDYPKIWPEAAAVEESFHRIWEKVAGKLKGQFSTSNIYVKAHPKTPLLPESLVRFQIVDADLPLELWEFPQLRFLIFDASGAASVFLARSDVVCLSLLAFYGPPLSERLHALLLENVDPEHKARILTTTDELDGL